MVDVVWTCSLSSLNHRGGVGGTNRSDGWSTVLMSAVDVSSKDVEHEKGEE